MGVAEGAGGLDRSRCWRRRRGWAREWPTGSPRCSGACGRCGGLDTSRHTEERERERTEDDEARERAELDAAVTDAEAVVTAARRTRGPATIAAALQLSASTLLSRAWHTRSVEDARAAVAAAREAARTRDGLGGGELPWALVSAALLESTEQDPARQRTFEERRDDPSLVFLLHEMARVHPELGAILRERADLDEAARLRMAVSREALGPSDLVLGRLAGHEALVGAASASQRHPSTRTPLELRQLLRPGDLEVELRRSLVDV